MRYGRVFVLLVVLIILAQVGIRTAEPGPANLTCMILASLGVVDSLAIIALLWWQYHRL